LTKFGIFWETNPSAESVCALIPKGPGGPLSPGIFKSEIYFRFKKLLAEYHKHHRDGTNCQKFAGG